MYKIDSFEQELYESMEDKLVSNQKEAKYGYNRLSKAADFLNSAAKLFENAGMHKEAKEVTKVLKSLSSKWMEVGEEDDEPKAGREIIDPSTSINDLTGLPENFLTGDKIPSLRRSYEDNPMYHTYEPATVAKNKLERFKRNILEHDDQLSSLPKMKIIKMINILNSQKNDANYMEIDEKIYFLEKRYLGK